MSEPSSVQSSDAPHSEGRSVSYSWMFRELVTGQDDVVGMLAYGLYKFHKIEHIQQIEMQGRAATEEEIDQFCRFAQMPTTRQSYLDRAEKLYADMLDVTINAEFEILAQEQKDRDDIRKDLVQTQYNEIIQKVQKIHEVAEGKKTIKERMIEAILGAIAGLIVISALGGLVFGIREFDRIQAGIMAFFGIS